MYLIGRISQLLRLSGIAHYKYLRYQGFNLWLLLEATSTTPNWSYVCVTDVFIWVALYLTITHSTCITSCAYRAFLEQVGPWILLLESVDYFGTSDYFSGLIKGIILISKTSRFPEKNGFEDRWSRLEDRLKKNLKINKLWIGVMSFADGR